MIRAFILEIYRLTPAELHPNESFSSVSDFRIGNICHLLVEGIRLLEIHAVESDSGQQVASTRSTSQFVASSASSVDDAAKSSECRLRIQVSANNVNYFRIQSTYHKSTSLNEKLPGPRRGDGLG